MKSICFLALLLFLSNAFGQTSKNLDETKAYIVKMVNEFGWEEGSDRYRLQAVFEDDLLKIESVNNYTSKNQKDGRFYDFSNIYQYKGPIKKPGNRARVIVWVDSVRDPERGKWKKENLDFDMASFDAAEQLMVAFRHLNELLIAKKPAIEKF